MNFRIDRWSATALRSSLVAVTVVGTLLLTSCGGSGSENQSVTFQATRLIVFGDETSLLLPPSSPTALDARKYSVNGFTPNTTPVNSVPDCRANQLWVQYLSSRYGLIFGECNPNGAPVTAQMRAAYGARVDDLVRALDTFLATSTFGSKDLVTVMVGTHDVFELYDSLSTGALTEAAAVIEAQRRGRLLAAQVDRIVKSDNSGGRVLYVPVPDVSQSPFAVSTANGLTDAQRTERVRLLTLISRSFNDKLRGTITNNGRSIGLVDAFQLFRNVINNAKANDYANVTDAACTTAVVTDCTSLTLQPANGTVNAATDFTWLWADDRHLSAGGQELLGNRADSIVRNNPF
ncbi:MAG: hypothetical protein QFE16_05890 [Pseudomonadota bacterium]|nr:hypothetical protein [Pseudomonadota bacterium]